MTKKTVLLAKAAESKQKKIESDANDIRAKYPEIAKMTVAEVVETHEFAIQLEKAIVSYRAVNFYAFQSLRREKILEPDNFRKEYIAVLDKESNKPAVKRTTILVIGNDAYKRTIKQMIKEYDEKKVHS